MDRQVDDRQRDGQATNGVYQQGGWIEELTTGLRWAGR